METQTLGDLIKAARLRKGWTQEELAARLGVKDSYISQWERGGRKWPKEHVRALSRVLGITQYEMAVAAGLIEREAGREPPPVVDFRLQEIVDAWPTMTADAQRFLHSFLALPGVIAGEEPRVASLAR